MTSPHPATLAPRASAGKNTFPFSATTNGVFLLSWQNAEAFPQWITWAPLFRALQTFHETLGKPGLDEKSENFQAIQLREALRQASPALARASATYGWATTTDLRGTDIIRSLLSDIDALLG